MQLSFRLDKRPGESHLALDGKKNEKKEVLLKNVWNLSWRSTRWVNPRSLSPLYQRRPIRTGEVTNLLKGLNGPVLKSVRHGGDHLEFEFDDGTGLLDGGATHPLRQGSIEEIKNAVQSVELAHGATQLH